MPDRLGARHIITVCASIPVAGVIMMGTEGPRPSPSPREWTGG
ncbi:MAG: hypothetical protein WAL98_16110 [Desulfatiglandaceae bacterium]